MQRISEITSHLRGNSSALGSLLKAHDDDIVITLALRSPLCKARKGGMKDTRADELLTAFLKAIIPRMGVPPAAVEEITVGRVLGDGTAYECRAASLVAGFPDTTTVQVINRFCSSGLMAVQSVANAIRNGEYDIGLAVGVESMSYNADRGAPDLSAEIMAHPVARDNKQPMGWTSENVARDFCISREKMDEYAALSHQRASEAQRAGRFVDEIVPVEVFRAKSDSASKEAKAASSAGRDPVVIREDDGIRHGTTKEALGKIKGAFPQWSPSNTTGGNASQLTDGAAAVLLMKRSKARELGLPILAKHVKTVTSGLPPRIMGIGPSFAIPKLLEKTGLSTSDIDLFEINEAFASMYVYCVEKLGLPFDRVNVNGGAIALGHPLGCTGARQIATGLSELRRRKAKTLVSSMCVGSGQAAAALFVAE